MLDDGAARLVRAGRLLTWTPAGYEAGERAVRTDVRVITPPSLVAVLRAGWDGSVPLLHPTAG